MSNLSRILAFCNKALFASDSYMAVFIMHRTFSLPNGAILANYIRISGNQSQQGTPQSWSPNIYPSLSLLSELHSFWSMSIFLIYDYWLGEYFHLGDLRALHSLHIKKCNDSPSRYSLPLIFFFTQAWNLWLSLTLHPIILRYVFSPSSRALLSPPSIPGAHVFLSLT